MAARRSLLVSFVLARCALPALALSAGSIRMSADIPVALRPLQRQEIVDKLDGVPVFSVVNRQTQQVVPTAEENGVLCCYFHVDVDEATASLAALQARNPTLELGLTATPLGTAYALCEWERQAAQAGDEEESGALGLDDDDDDDSPGGGSFDDGSFGGSEGAAPTPAGIDGAIAEEDEGEDASPAK